MDTLYIYLIILKETSQAESAPLPLVVASNSEKEPVPLVDYIHNVMKFVDAILSNNSTDDHCREFVNQVQPLLMHFLFCYFSENKRKL